MARDASYYANRAIRTAFEAGRVESSVAQDSAGNAWLRRAIAEAESGSLPADAPEPVPGPGDATPASSGPPPELRLSEADVMNDLIRGARAGQPRTADGRTAREG